MTQPTKIGRYEIIERVGRGGMGAVYRGRDTVLDREVAIKVMSSDFAGDETSRPRFYREARAAAKLQHRNIVTIFEFGEEDDTPFIVMEFLRGQDLSKRMQTKPPLLLGQKIEIIAELCTGLHFAHEQGVIHRDVKPANIWLVPDGSVKLLDFGIAKFASSTMTRQGSVFGSISYMSREQVAGSDVDGRADIFSAGVVLYELLSGKKPFAGDSPTAVLARIMDDEPVSVAELPADVPKPLVASLVKALEKDRDKRYRHAADFCADLRLVRTALSAASDELASDVDLVPTMLTDSGSGRTIDGGRRQTAGSVTVARTLPLEVTAPEPAPEPEVETRGGRRWLVPALAAVLTLAAVGGYVYWPGTPPRTGPQGGMGPGPRPVVPRQATVRIVSEPPGATIFVDDKDMHLVTPADITVETTKLPSVKITRGGQTIQYHLTQADVQARTWQGRFNKETQVVSNPGPPSPDSRTIVTVIGEYPVEVLDERGRTISPFGPSHEFPAKGRSTIRLRNPNYYLDRPFSVDLTQSRVPIEPPPTAQVDIIAHESCSLVKVDTAEPREPPITGLAMVEGVHRAELTCSDGKKTENFFVRAGEKNVITLGFIKR